MYIDIYICIYILYNIYLYVYVCHKDVLPLACPHELRPLRAAIIYSIE